MGLFDAILGAGSSLIAAKGQQEAASAQSGVLERSQAASIAAQKEMAQKSIDAYTNAFNQSRADLQPFRDAQLSAIGRLSALSDPNNPYYQAERTMQTQQIQRQLAAQGLLRSRNQSDLLSNLELGLMGQRISALQALAGGDAGNAYASLSQGYGSQVGGTYSNLGQGVGSTFQAYGSPLASAAGMGVGAPYGGWANVLNRAGNAFSMDENQRNTMKIIAAMQGYGAPGAAPETTQTPTTDYVSTYQYMPPAPPQRYSLGVRY